MKEQEILDVMKLEECTREEAMEIIKWYYYQQALDDVIREHEERKKGQ